MARHKKEINIRLVAEEAGVSLATVSRVINNRTDVSEAMRRRVSAVVERFNFAPTKGVERRFNIGVVAALEAPGLATDYMLQILDGISNYNSDGTLDVTIILYRTDSQPKPLLQVIRERRCDAVALLPPSLFAGQIPELIEAEIPTMLINGSLRGPKLGFVNNESYTGAVRMMEYLASRGHRRIGFLCNNLNNDDNHQQRLRAYLDIISKINPGAPSRWIIGHKPTPQTPDAGYNQCVQLLENSPEVTAVFCTNDEMAVGAIKACWDRGLRVPEDISVVGFDDIPCGRYLHPALTTVKQPLLELGARTIRYLDEFLKNKRTTLPGERLETELVLRESVAEAKK